MARTCIEKLTARLDKLVTGVAAAGRDLNLTFVYEEETARQWAAEVFDRVERGASLGPVRSTWWRLDDLHHPGVMAGAVSKAMRADLIVVAARATEGLPLPFYFWVNAWLPHYPAGSGALVGLLGAVTGASQHGRLRNYLKAVARQARMGFMLHERTV